MDIVDKPSFIITKCLCVQLCWIDGAQCPRCTSGKCVNCASLKERPGAPAWRHHRCSGRERCHRAHGHRESVRLTDKVVLCFLFFTCSLVCVWLFVNIDCTRVVLSGPWVCNKSLVDWLIDSLILRVEWQFNSIPFICTAHFHKL